MINVCFSGITGWTAAALVPAIDSADDLRLTAGVSRSAAGASLADAVGSTSAGMVYGSVAEAVAAADVDVVVDYTSATAVRTNILAAIQAGVGVVVGSSGLTTADYVEIDGFARQRKVGVVAAGNFSVMAAVLSRVAAIAAGQLDSWEIIDYASAGKPDVPSGTSREVAETMAMVRRPVVGVPVSELHGPQEARGACVDGTQIHSVRLPSFVVSTEVVFGGAGERLVLRHDAGESPQPYVDGTLLAIRRVVGTLGVVRGLASLLFDQRGKRAE